LYKRFILLQKFFNVNQIDDTQYDILKHKEIKTIYEKMDGSLISFIELPNGKVLARTKMGFDNDQAIDAQKIYDASIDIQNLLAWCFSNNIVAIFEYISPKNRIVIKYPSDDLILLRLRDNKNGNY